MIKYRILFLVFAGVFITGNVFAQDGLLGEETQESTEDVVCIPEDLSVSYDKFAGKIKEELEVKKLYSFGGEYFKNKNYTEAIPLLWKVFVNDSGKLGNLAIGKIAESYFYEKNVDSALIACYRGFEKYPDDDNQKLHYWAGFLEKELGKSSCAIPHYDALVEKNPKNVPYLKTLAWLLYKEGDERSVEIQKRVIDLVPNDAEAQDSYAIYLKASGASPREAYKESCSNDPSNVDACFNFAKSSIEEGFFQEAVDPLTNIIKVQPKNKEAFRYRAIAYENLGQNRNAITDLEAWLNLESENADIMLYIAVNYSAIRRFTTANSWINRAISKKPGYGKPFIVRGEMYESMVGACQGSKLELEDQIVYEEAQKVYEQAKKDPIFRSTATTKINNLQPLIRTPDKIFMEPNAKVVNPCYEFLVGKMGKKQ